MTPVNALVAGQSKRMFHTSATEETLTILEGTLKGPTDNPSITM